MPKATKIRHTRKDLDWSVKRMHGWKTWHWRIIKENYHTLVLSSSWAALEELFDVKASELKDPRQTKTANDIARRIGKGDAVIGFDQVSQFAALLVITPRSLTDDEQRFFAAIKGSAIRSAYKNGALTSCCAQLTGQMVEWGDEDRTRVVYKRSPDAIFKKLSPHLEKPDPKSWFSIQQNPKYHRQEIVNMKSAWKRSKIARWRSDEEVFAVVEPL